MKVYVVMKWDFDDETDEMIDIYRKRAKAIEKCDELAKFAIVNRTNKDVVKGYDWDGTHYGYIVRWTNNEYGEYPNNDKMYYVKEKEIIN